MATPTDPAQQYAQEVTAVQSDLSSLQMKVHLADARGAVEDLNTKLSGLPQEVRTLRDRKYAFDIGMATRVSTLIEQWAPSYASVKAYLDQQAQQLGMAIRPIESQVGFALAQSGNPQYGLSMIQSLKGDMSTLDSRASSVISTASNMYDEIQSRFQALKTQIDRVSWMLDRMDEASFSFLPDEAGIMAVKATWLRDGREDKDDPQGILFLTDHRLIFEQNQEVATKKVLFVVTERKKVQQLQLEVQVNLVEDIKASKQGLFKNEDQIDLRLGHGASVQTAQFHIFGQDGAEWQGLVNRARIYDFEKERVMTFSPAEAERIKAAPTECTACGGAITKPIMRGQDTITCEFCGNIMRI
jgi:hypothetical protein